MVYFEAPGMPGPVSRDRQGARRGACRRRHQLRYRTGDRGCSRCLARRSGSSGEGSHLAFWARRVNRRPTMKLAYLCNEYPPAEHGGIGTFIQAIARGMKTLGHTVTVVGIGRHKRVYDDSGVTVVTLPTIGTRGIAWVLDRWRLNRWLSERVARREIDLIEAPEFGGMLPFGNPGCPVVIRLHLSATMIRALPRDSAKWSTVQYCERKTLRQNRNWIGVTDWMLNHTITGFGIAPVTSRVIYN